MDTQDEAEKPEAPAPLRTDGPTLEEYVAAGYPADTYPPTGYAVKEANVPARPASNKNTPRVDENGVTHWD